MTDKTNNDFLLSFLHNPGYRILRHVFLWIFILIMAAGYIWYIPEENMTAPNKFIGLFFYALIFAAGIYFNIYFLVPKLFLKNKWLLYVVSLLVIVILSILSVIFAQEYLYDSNRPIEPMGPFLTFVNIVSGVIAFALLFAGTTTPILFKYWITDMRHADELESATLESELKLLKGQINPHFLFNMLNNVNMLIKKRNKDVPDVLFKLRDLLKYQINDSSKDEVLLNSDIHFLNSFLNLEKIRRDKFEFIISTEGDISNIKIPPLLFIPFVENAVKHNNDSANLSYVYLNFEVTDGKLIFSCINSKPVKARRKSETGGLGQTNIKRRLELLFPDRYTLEIKDEETMYSVYLALSL